MKSDNKKEIMLIMYNEAKLFLSEICPKEIDIRKYFNLEKHYKTKNDILYTLLVCLQDRQMADKVIGLMKEDRKDIFQRILFNYDEEKILEYYNEETLLKKFSDNFIIKNIESKNNLWRLYAKSVISSAKFLSSFNNIKDFDEFVNSYTNNKIELPRLLQKEIFGMGFALACHFLKDLGYSDYAKPDVHIKDVFMAFLLCDDSDDSVFNVVSEMSEIVNDSAYNIDKLFWLICSGNFHYDNILIGRNKEQYIRRVKNILEDKLKNEIEQNGQDVQITNMSKYKNNDGNIYGKITLDQCIANKFLKDKDTCKVIVKYDNEKDCLVINKI